MSTAQTRSPGATHEQLARRAYEIWLAEGRPAGREHEHWQQAQRELTGQAALEPVRTVTQRKPAAPARPARRKVRP